MSAWVAGADGSGQPYYLNQRTGDMAWPKRQRGHIGAGQAADVPPGLNDPPGGSTVPTKEAAVGEVGADEAKAGPPRGMDRV